MFTPFRATPAAPTSYLHVENADTHVKRVPSTPVDMWTDGQISSSLNVDATGKHTHKSRLQMPIYRRFVMYT